MSQSKKMSLTESLVNTVVGLLVSFGIQNVIYPALKIDVTLSENIIITFVFFFASIVRGYILRRLFTKL